MYKSIIGIDPGKSGGLCMYNGGDFVLALPCPDDEKGMAESISNIVEGLGEEGISLDQTLVAIENVHAFPTDTRSSAFKFGANYGTWLGILAANNLKVQKIHPRVWMKKYGELPKDKLKRKRYLREIAKECFPDARVTLKTTDAILIAKYRFEFEEV